MQFYDGQLARSWVPAYLAERGISDAAMRHWHIGYAPGGWTTLTGHLFADGHWPALNAVDRDLRPCPQASRRGVMEKTREG